MARKKAKPKAPALGTKDVDLLIGVLTEAFKLVQATGRLIAADYIMKQYIGPLHKQKVVDAKRAKPKPARTRYRDVQIGKGKVGTFWVPDHIEIEEIEDV